MKSILYFSLFFILGIVACSKTKERDVYSAFKPVLMESNKVTTDLKILPVQESKTITQMRQMGNYLLALDYGIGIHIIDASNPDNPVKKGFYQIPACIDFEVKGNTIYANNYRDFIVVDFTNALQPLVVKRETNAFDVNIKALDGLRVHDKLKEIPANTTIISYEKI